MKILALEFSSATHSAAVLDAMEGKDAALGEAVETGSRSTHAFELIESALRAAHLEREQLEIVAVGLGPGSYTGIRAAIAVAQGWQLARPVKCLGISSAACLAAQAFAQGLRGRVHVVIDAQRQEFYIAGYEIDDIGPREIEPLHLAGTDKVRSLEDAGAVLIGPEVVKWFPQGRLLFPSAAILCQLATRRSDSSPAETLAPIYLRETRFVKAPPPRVVQ